MMDDKKTQQDQFVGKVFFNKYVIQKKLGEGSFGSIYSANFKDEDYALKFENRTKGQGLLEAEAYIMSYLKGFGIPFVKSYGYSQEYNILVMELLGKSLEDIFIEMPEKKMSMKCVCNIGYQMISILQYIHDRHIIHQDIKPDNFVIGVGDKANQLYLLDFGLAKKYRSSSTLNHYPMTNKRKLTGTARYASINALNGFEQSRRDDLEAVGYVLMYFLRGALPWQGLPVKNKEDRYLRIMEKKRDTSPMELCNGFSKEFEEYVTYTRNLAYEQDPDYEYLKELFIAVLRLQNQIIDYTYDWTSSAEMRDAAAKEKASLKNNPTRSHQAQHNNNNNELDPTTNGPQITVVNNYYHNVQNILIQSTDRDKNKEKKRDNQEPEKKLSTARIDTIYSITKENNNNYRNYDITNPKSKRNRNSNLLQTSNTNFNSRISQENKNNQNNYSRYNTDTNQKNYNPLLTSNVPNSQSQNRKENIPSISNNNSNIIVTKKEDNKCCIII